MAEQLRFHQVLGNCTAVDDHKRLVLARTALVDGVGDQFLAGAGLARHKHADVGAGDLLDRAEHLDHGCARADDVAETIAIDLLFERIEARF